MLKVCSMTCVADALHAVRHGATAVGFIFWPKSPRFVGAARAAAIIRELPAGLTIVGVFVNQTISEIRRIASVTGITAVQLHGDEPPAFLDALPWPIWRAVPLAHAGVVLPGWPEQTTILLDAHDPVRRGGTGQVIDWSEAAAISARRRVVLAGGLTPANVGEAIAAVRPFGVDVSSGVEEAPGVKDPDKVARFLERARTAFDEY
jgi:phosphoribosylanthranilate isomerase